MQSNSTSRVRFTVISYTPVQSRFDHTHIVYRRNWDSSCLVKLSTVVWRFTWGNPLWGEAIHFISLCVSELMEHSFGNEQYVKYSLLTMLVHVHFAIGFLDHISSHNDDIAYLMLLSAGANCALACDMAYNYVFWSVLDVVSWVLTIVKCASSIYVLSFIYMCLITVPDNIYNYPLSWTYVGRLGSYVANSKCYLLNITISIITFQNSEKMIWISSVVWVPLFHLNAPTLLPHLKSYFHF